jgi:predicted XRE-type DNA-binding protein
MKREMQMTESRTEQDDVLLRNDIIEGCGNVFEDLNLPHSQEDMLKIEISRAIAGMLKVRKLTQVKAAELLGIDQPKVSALLRGHLKGYSIDRLVGYLLMLGFDVDVRLSENAPGRTGHLKVSHAVSEFESADRCCG